MTIPRTHCHFTMQARAQRVPEFCDDHTLPSCLVTNSLAEPRYRSVNILALSDPSLTQGPAFRQLVRLGASWPVLFACLYRRSLKHLPFRCLPSLFFRVHVEEQQNMLLPHGTTGSNHSYYTGTPHSAPHSSSYNLVRALRSLCRYWPPHGSHMVQRLSSESCPQVTHSAISPQVQKGATRTVTSDFVSASLAEAAMQLSFAEFLERCIFLSALRSVPSPDHPPLDRLTLVVWVCFLALCFSVRGLGVLGLDVLGLFFL